MEILAQTLGAEGDKTQCSIQFKTPENVAHTPTHYVLLIDISSSMEHDSKLSNVKACIRLLIPFLKDTDKLSLITFGDSSEIIIHGAPVQSSTKEQLLAKINAMHTDGMTNLSAGLANVAAVVNTADPKTGLLILTDGNANRGVSEDAPLIQLLTNLKTQFSNLSVCNIAYGNDHNASLLKSFAEVTQGSYSIVDSIDTTAYAFGDVLGSLMSCCAQNTTILVPKDTVVHGPHTVKAVNGGKLVSVGDLYTGTKTTILVDIPTAALASVRVSSVLLPELIPFQKDVGFVEAVERDIEIEVTRLRYECTSLLNRLGKFFHLNAMEQGFLKTDVEVFKQKLLKPEYADNLVIKSLLNEIPLMEEALNPSNPHDTHVYLAQHSATVGLGRGYSSPIRPQRPPMAPGAPRRRRGHRSPSPPPGSIPMAPGSVPPPPAEEDPIMSPFQNNTRSQMSHLMRTMSRQPDNM